MSFESVHSDLILIRLTEKGSKVQRAVGFGMDQTVWRKRGHYNDADCGGECRRL